jgi:hypothetical protein
MPYIIIIVRESPNVSVKRPCNENLNPPPLLVAAMRGDAMAGRQIGQVDQGAATAGGEIGNPPGIGQGRGRNGWQRNATGKNQHQQITNEVVHQGFSVLEVVQAWGDKDQWIWILS